MSIAYSITKNNSATSHLEHPERWGAFNEAIQAFLLPRLHENGMAIDLYDGGEFTPSQLESVANAIRGTSLAVLKLPDDLYFTKEMMNFYYSYSIEPRPTPKESALKSLFDLESFCQKAKSENEILFFVGD